MNKKTLRLILLVSGILCCFGASFFISRALLKRPLEVKSLPSASSSIPLDSSDARTTLVIPKDDMAIWLAEQEALRLAEEQAAAEAAAAEAAALEAAKLPPYECPIDFEELQNINPDIYAWIDIESLGISYPILQKLGGDQYYLTHSYQGWYDPNYGSIYTHDENTRTFEDFNTIIYGHNLIQGGMFTDLERYYDKEFLDANREIVIYMPDKQLCYTIYASVIYNDYLLDYLFDFSKDADRRAFLDSLETTGNARSYVYTDMEVGVDDHFITLSTCVSGESAYHRLLVVAVLDHVLVPAE